MSRARTAASASSARPARRWRHRGLFEDLRLRGRGLLEQSSRVLLRTAERDAWWLGEIERQLAAQGSRRGRHPLGSLRRDARRRNRVAHGRGGVDRRRRGLARGRVRFGGPRIGGRAHRGGEPDPADPGTATQVLVARRARRIGRVAAACRGFRGSGSAFGSGFVGVEGGPGAVPSVSSHSTSRGVRAGGGVPPRTLRERRRGIVRVSHRRSAPPKGAQERSERPVTSPPSPAGGPPPGGPASPPARRSSSRATPTSACNSAILSAAARSITSTRAVSSRSSCVRS